LGTGMGFNFSSPLGMGRVTGKYIQIGYGDGEGKTRPHPAPIAMPRRMFDEEVRYFNLYIFVIFFMQTDASLLKQKKTSI
jgi:hypothetical protein